MWFHFRYRLYPIRAEASVLQAAATIELGIEIEMWDIFQEQEFDTIKLRT